MNYHYITIDAGSQRFLRPLFEALGCQTLRVWTEATTSPEDFDRIRCAGLVTALAECQGRTVAIAWSDFRVNAASYGHGTSRRFSAFLRELRRADGDPVPLLYFVNSAGLSLMEGRAVFSDAFELWPELLAFAERHLLLTCATGKCLGLAALLFGLGHYRVAMTGRTQLNLTGPDVIRLFFGQGVDFAENAAAERSHQRTDLVHELVPSIEVAIARFMGIIARGASVEGAPSVGERAGEILAAFLDSAPQELIPGWCPRVRLFVGTRAGKPVGIFINPPERSNNMITVRTLDKYAAGLDLFGAMRLPIVSFLDSPGIDPRFDQSDANNLRRILRVGAKIIGYGHGSMGVVIGRCFGGATTLSFPKVFGSRRSVALRGSRIGAMHETIIGQVLSGSPRLLEQWRAVAATQGNGFEDLLEEGSLDAVIEVADLAGEMDRFLGTEIPVRAPVRRRRHSTGSRRVRIERLLSRAAGDHKGRPHSVGDQAAV